MGDRGWPAAASHGLSDAPHRPAPRSCPPVILDRHAYQGLVIVGTSAAAWAMSRDCAHGRDHQ